MIPKILHVIWIGKKDPPLWCIDSWRKKYINIYPQWEFILWDETRINKLSMINRTIYDLEPTLRGKSDIARYEILYQYGGIFLDADSYWIEKENSDLNILLEKDKHDFFCANEPKNTKYFANGVFGSSKNNILLMKIIEYLKVTYQEKKKKHPNKYDIWQVTGPVPFSKIIVNHIDLVTIFPHWYFFPEAYKKNNTSIKLDKLKDLFPDSFMYQYWLSHTNYYRE